MILLFTGLKGLFKKKTIVNDGFVFQLHTRFTVLILLSACTLLSSKQFFGDPIYCIQKDVISLKVLETFCWNHATYVLPDFWNATVGVKVPHPGIDKTTAESRKLYHGYYQWVGFVLFLQSILFYLPRYLWRCWEKGKIRDVMLNLNDPLLPREKVKESADLIVEFLNRYWGKCGFYFRSYFFCEILSLINVIGQMFVLNKFLNGVFMTFGVKVLMWTDWEQDYRSDPLVEAFPRMTKCRFYEYGSSGDVQKYDALCLLPLNNLNEKIFIFLWFWMLFLLIISFLTLLYRLLLCGMPILRYCLIISKSPCVHKGALDQILLHASMGEWYILYLLAKNTQTQHFRILISQLATVINEKDYYSPITKFKANNGESFV